MLIAAKSLKKKFGRTDVFFEPFLGAGDPRPGGKDIPRTILHNFPPPPPKKTIIFMQCKKLHDLYDGMPINEIIFEDSIETI